MKEEKRNLSKEDLDNVSGGLRAVELKDGGYVVISDDAKIYDLVEKSPDEIPKIKIKKPHRKPPRCPEPRILPAPPGGPPVEDVLPPPELSD